MVLVRSSSVRVLIVIVRSVRSQSLLALILLLWLMPVAHALPYLFVPLSDGTVAVYDLGNHDALLGKLGVGPDPTAFAASPLGGVGYVANTGSETLNQITATATQLETTLKVTLTGDPDALAYSPEGAAVYVALGPQNDIAEVGTNGGTVALQTIAVGPDPDALAVTSDGALIFVANANGDDVSVVSAPLAVVVATIPVGIRPDALVINPEGTTVYVANGGSGTVSVIDRATRQVVKTITVGADPVALALSPAGSHLFVADAGSSSISVIDTASNTVTTTIALTSPPSALAFDPSGRALYAVEPSARQVVAINPTLDVVTDAIALPATPTVTGNAFVGQGDLVALSQGLSTTTNVEVTGTLGCGDVLGRPRDFSLVIPPAHGRLLLGAATGDFEYIPATNYTGDDVFAFRCTSAVGGPDPVSNVATAAIAISNGNVSISSGSLSLMGLGILLGAAMLRRRSRWRSAFWTG